VRLEPLAAWVAVAGAFIVRLFTARMPGGGPGISPGAMDRDEG
jgi:hypothetical protein